MSEMRVKNLKVHPRFLDKFNISHLNRSLNSMLVALNYEKVKLSAGNEIFTPLYSEMHRETVFSYFRFPDVDRCCYFHQIVIIAIAENTVCCIHQPVFLTDYLRKHILEFWQEKYRWNMVFWQEKTAHLKLSAKLVSCTDISTPTEVCWQNIAESPDALNRKRKYTPVTIMIRMRNDIEDNEANL